MVHVTAARMHAVGGPNVLQLESIELPAIGDDDVQIAVAAAGINYPDRLVRSGALPVASFPHVPGFEASGTIEAIGAGVTSFAIGDRVVAELPRGGGYATRVVVPTAAVTKIPNEIAFDAALTLSITGTTALLMLRHARLASNESVLIPSALGGVGSIAMRLAIAMGATVIAGVGSESKRKLALERGAAAAVVLEDEWSQQVREATGGKGADVIFQSSPGGESLRALAPLGRLVLFGAENFVHPESLSAAKVQGVIAQGQSLGGFALMRMAPSVRKLAFEELMQRVATNALPLDIQHFSLRDVQLAHSELDARRTIGKVVLTI